MLHGYKVNALGVGTKKKDYKIENSACAPAFPRFREPEQAIDRSQSWSHHYNVSKQRLAGTSCRLVVKQRH